VARAAKIAEEFPRRPRQRQFRHQRVAQRNRRRELQHGGRDEFFAGSAQPFQNFRHFARSIDRKDSQRVTGFVMEPAAGEAHFDVTGFFGGARLVEQAVRGDFRRERIFFRVK
jgi:hypothetical protein